MTELMEPTTKSAPVESGTAIDFYFDFVSPFSYLAHHRLCEIADKAGTALRYHAIDVAQAKLAAGNTGPSNRDIPPKGRYFVTDLKRWAKRYEIPITLPVSFAGRPKVSELPNRGIYFAIEQGQARDYVNAVWDRAWALGEDLGSPEFLRAVARDLGWDAGAFLAHATSEASGAAYEAGNRAAHAKGVFGVPTMMVSDEMWWGNDRVEFVADHLETVGG